MANEDDNQATSFANQKSSVANTTGTRDDLAELKESFDAFSPLGEERPPPTSASANSNAQVEDPDKDADLEVEGCGKFYDRISLSDYRKRDDERHSHQQPRSILKNKMPSFTPASAASSRIQPRKLSRSYQGGRRYDDYQDYSSNMRGYQGY